MICRMLWERFLFSLEIYPGRTVAFNIKRLGRIIPIWMVFMIKLIIYKIYLSFKFFYLI